MKWAQDKERFFMKFPPVETRVLFFKFTNQPKELFLCLTFLHRNPLERYHEEVNVMLSGCFFFKS